MDPLRLICETDGFFTRAMAEDIGHSDREIAQLVRSAHWIRFRRGYYCFADMWSRLDDRGKHLVRCRAVQHSLGDRVALSHVSGAVVHGLDVWGADLSRVHVTRLDGASGRIERDVVHHEGRLGADEVTTVDGLRVLPVLRCAVECASTSRSEAALVVFDSLLHRGLADVEALERRCLAMGAWPHMRHLHVPMRMADGRAASPGESRGRWLFWTLHVPAPDLQVEIFDTAGEHRATCDWGWRERGLFGEFDGRVKYGRLLRPGQDPGDVVFAEKQREDEIREITGCTMIRLIWTDYDRPRVVRARFDRLLRPAS
jgi:hypothetical protein